MRKLSQSVWQRSFRAIGRANAILWQFALLPFLINIPIIKRIWVGGNGRLVILPGTRLDLRNSVLNVTGWNVARGGCICLADSTCDLSNSKLLNSRIRLSNSSIRIGDDSTVQRSRLTCTNATVRHEPKTFLSSAVVEVRNGSFVTSEYLFLAHGAEIVVTDGAAQTGRNCRIQGRVWVRDGEFRCGENVWINNRSDVRAWDSIMIGSNVFISYECLLFDNNSHSLDFEMRREEIRDGFPFGTKQSHKSRPDSESIAIGSDVWIGQRAVVLKGVTIGDRCTIALGSVVTKSVDSDMLAAGNPARTIRRLQYESESGSEHARAV